MLLAARTVCAPSLANARAVALPMPLLAPVMMTVLFFKSMLSHPVYAVFDCLFEWDDWFPFKFGACFGIIKVSIEEAAVDVVFGEFPLGCCFDDAAECVEGDSEHRAERVSWRSDVELFCDGCVDFFVCEVVVREDVLACSFVLSDDLCDPVYDVSDVDDCCSSWCVEWELSFVDSIDYRGGVCGVAGAVDESGIDDDGVSLDEFVGEFFAVHVVFVRCGVPVEGVCFSDGFVFVV